MFNNTDTLVISLTTDRHYTMVVMVWDLVNVLTADERRSRDEDGRLRKDDSGVTQNFYKAFDTTFQIYSIPCHKSAKVLKC